MVSYHLPHFTLIEELQALDDIEEGVSHDAVCAKYSIVQRDVRRTIRRKQSLKKISRRCNANGRKFSTLADKVKICHAHSKMLNNSAVARTFDLDESVVRRIVKNKDTWVQQVRDGVSIDAQRSPKPKHPAIDDKLTEFVEILRHSRVPVTLSLMQTRAREVAVEMGIPEFTASRGYIQKYLRRSKVRASFKLHGKGGNARPDNFEERMAEIRSVAEDYESGLFYRMGPSRTYLMQSESRDDTRGTDLQKYKQRLSIVFCVNADGSHKLPMRYIGVPKKPNCFHVDGTHYHQYSCQSRGWMNGPGFKKWMEFWYEEVKQQSQGPYLLILDNCGGHESGIDPLRPDVRIEFLPKNSTTCAQPLDAGLISTAKSRYRKRYLTDTVHVVLTWQQEGHGYKDSTGQGKWGIREGQLPHVGDAIRMFNEVWEQTSNIEVMKCWLKAECLPTVHTQELRRQISESEEPTLDLTSGHAVDVPTSNVLEPANPSIPDNEVQALSELIQQCNLLNVSDSPTDLSDLVTGFANDTDNQLLVDALHPSTDAIRAQDELTESYILTLATGDTADEFLQSTVTVTEAEAPSIHPSVGLLQACVMEIEKVTEDATLLDHLQRALSRAEELSSVINN